jgi:hypothetical protein
MEGRAQTLEKDHQDKNLRPGLASNDYSKAKHDYQSTKAGLDGWIGRVKIAIRTREPIGNTQPFLEDWVNRSQAFVALADGFDRKAQGLPPRLAIEGPHVSISLIPSLLEAATKIWVEFEKLDDERKDKMIRDLEGLKCKPWP